MIYIVYFVYICAVLIGGSIIQDRMSPGPKQGVWQIIVLSSILYTTIPYLAGLAVIQHCRKQVVKYTFVVICVPVVFIAARFAEIFYFKWA
jgi:hypothetical protein